MRFSISGRAAIPAMRAKKDRRHHPVSSTAGIRGIITNIAYKSPKAPCLNSLALWRANSANDNIRINCVAQASFAPNFMRT
jgi:NADP-dependent 3-hydroxy acid dehydrogenase YdfG